MVYHLDKCGVYEGLWEESNMDEKDQKKTDKKEKCFVIMPISDPEGYETVSYTHLRAHETNQSGQMMINQAV